MHRNFPGTTEAVKVTMHAKLIDVCGRHRDAPKHHHHARRGDQLGSAGGGGFRRRRWIRGRPSADCCCDYLNLFTDRAAAKTWAAAHPRVPGQILTRTEAEDLARRLFGHLLTTS
jgi:hypothetical protein